MKLKYLLLFLITYTTCLAQQNGSTVVFNRWSIDGGIGLTKPFMNFSDGYYDDRVSPLASEIGVRFMLNEYFGFKLGFAYNQYKSDKNSLNFKTDQYTGSLQGVVNAGRLLRFEHWTQRINLLVHGGLGMGTLKYHEPTYSDDFDDVINLIGGFTGQFKLSHQVTLNLGVSAMSNFIQNHAFDGGDPNNQKMGMVINGTAGISFYIGRKNKHADWYLREDEISKNIKLEVADLAEKLIENDKKDLENTAKLQQISKTLNDAAKTNELNDESKITGNALNDAVMQNLTQNGYLNIYFDFDSSSIDKSFLGTIQFIFNYMKNKPDTFVTIEGYADEKGTDVYNIKLSGKRAETVQIYLSELGIDKKRITVVAKGKDQQLSRNSSIANSFARRVSITLKK